MWKNLARVAAEAQNGPGLWKFAGERGSDSTEIANWGLRYISIKTLYNNDDCLFRRHPRTPAICDTVVRIQPWTRKEKIGSKWVQTWMFGRQTFEFLEGARQMWAHCLKIWFGIHTPNFKLYVRIGEIIVSNILQARAAFSLLRFVCRLKLKRAWRAFSLRCSRDTEKFPDEDIRVPK